MKYRKKPVVIEATQWFKNGDHPKDKFNRSRNTEGKVVRRYNHPDTPSNHTCMQCQKMMCEHGWIDTLEGGHVVCPGDFVITGVKGERYPCKPDIFAATYEKVKGA